MAENRIVIVSNDVVPGSEMPVAAPGLRAYGLADGLAAHGLKAEIVMVSGPVDRQWNGEVPTPTRAGTMILGADRLHDYLAARRPVTVIITNSNQIDHFEKLPGITMVLDFFAPKMLELTYRDNEFPLETFAALRERKKRAIEKADGFIVNGRKKVPYFLAWIMQVDRDLRETELGVVPMAVPGHFVERKYEPPIRLVNAGYLQGWSHHGAWVGVLRHVLDQGGFELHTLTPPHWGRPEPEEPSESIIELVTHPTVVSHSPLRFEEFQSFLASADVSIDLFDWSWEREYAMVTRTVVALACGVPVIHPPFTEVSPVIAEHDAGWLVDPGDEEALESTLLAIRDRPEAVRRKAENARKAWETTFEPGAATGDLARIIRTLSGL